LTNTKKIGFARHPKHFLLLLFWVYIEVRKERGEGFINHARRK
jgi:hypothetical protein